MADGWETARRRTAGNDYMVVTLAGPARLSFVTVDTGYFLGNAPGRVRISARSTDNEPWHEILAERQVSPDSRNRFRLQDDEEVTAVRVDVYPGRRLLPAAPAGSALAAGAVGRHLAVAAAAAGPGIDPGAARCRPRRYPGAGAHRQAIAEPGLVAPNLSASAGPWLNPTSAPIVVVGADECYVGHAADYITKPARSSALSNDLRNMAGGLNVRPCQIYPRASRRTHIRWLPFVRREFSERIRGTRSPCAVHTRQPVTRCGDLSVDRVCPTVGQRYLAELQSDPPACSPVPSSPQESA